MAFGASLVAQLVKNLPANAGDMGLISDPGKFYMPQGNEAHVLQLWKPEF